MQPTAMAATEPTNDQDNGISGAINVFRRRYRKPSVTRYSMDRDSAPRSLRKTPFSGLSTNWEAKEIDSGRKLDK